ASSRLFNSRDAHPITIGVGLLGCEVCYVHDLFRQRHACKGSLRAGTYYFSAQHRLGICGRRTLERAESKCIALAQPEIAELGFADARGVREDGLKHWF